MDSQLLEQLQAADAQGERAVMSLWAGDQIYLFGDFHTIERLQWDTDRSSIWVTTDEPQGEPYELSFEGREPYMYQPKVMYRLPGTLLLPTLLSDEHAAAESGSDNEVW